MHGEHAVLDGQKVVHHREDGLLDLAAVAGTGDDDLLPVHIEHHRSGLDAIAVARAHVCGRREHHDVRAAEDLELILAGTDEHVLDEERLVRALAYDHDLARILTVGAGIAANHEQVAALRHVAHHVLAKALIGGLVDGLVGLAVPIHLLVGLTGVDDVTVLGAAAGKGTRRHGERTGRGEVCLMVRHGVLDELRGAPVHMDAIEIAVDSVFQQYRLDHSQYLSSPWRALRAIK